MLPRRVLVADSDALARWPIAERLRAAGFDVVEARTTADVVTHVARGLDLACIDESLGEEDGASALSRAAALDPDLTSVVLLRGDSSFTELDPARTLAFEAVTKPVVLTTLVAIVERGASVTRLRRDLRVERDASMPPPALVGESAAMARVRALIDRFATSPGSPALVAGEAGTGKRLVARTIHAASTRRTSPFVLIPCAALPEDALERALFGAEAGSSRPPTPGAFETTREGTSLLTSVERLPAALQARVLQVIEARTFRRAGGTVDVATESRVIATSSVDLDERVRAGVFRSDLFYRLGALRVDLPPLRARREDIPALARSFSQSIARDLDRAAPADVHADGSVLDDYLWPGNARELRHLVEHALLRAPDGDDPLDVTAAFRALHGPPATAGQDGGFVLPPEGVNLEDVERRLVIQALARAGGNQTKAAALLSIHRDQMRYRIEKFGLKT
jgi:two-component system response regulator AtoC